MYLLLNKGGAVCPGYVDVGECVCLAFKLCSVWVRWDVPFFRQTPVGVHILLTGVK